MSEDCPIVSHFLSYVSPLLPPSHNKPKIRKNYKNIILFSDKISTISKSQNRHIILHYILFTIFVFTFLSHCLLPLQQKCENFCISKNLHHHACPIKLRSEFDDQWWCHPKGCCVHYYSNQSKSFSFFL